MGQKDFTGNIIKFYWIYYVNCGILLTYSEYKLGILYIFFPDSLNKMAIRKKEIIRAY